MKRQFIEENSDLIEKERKLKRTNRITSVLILILLVVALVIGYQGFSGKRDSWFFKDILGINSSEIGVSTEATEEVTETTEETEETTSSVFELTNEVDGGSTNYIFKSADSNWTILETGKISGNDSLEVDLKNHIGVGSTDVILVTEYYGGFGNLMDSKEERFLITIE